MADLTGHDAGLWGDGHYISHQSSSITRAARTDPLRGAQNRMGPGASPFLPQGRGTFLRHEPYPDAYGVKPCHDDESTVLRHQNPNMWSSENPPASSIKP
jgi:hypothetical protein